MSQAFSIRRRRVSGCFAELIEKIQSRRAIGVMSSQPACASGAAARASRKSTGTLISGSSPARVISTVTVSPAFAPAASWKARLSLSRCLPLPSGSRAARKGKLLIVPSTIVVARGESFALAFLGRVRTVHDPIFSGAFGRSNLDRKRIVDLVSRSLASFMHSCLSTILRRITNQAPRRREVARNRLTGCLGPPVRATLTDVSRAAKAPPPSRPKPPQ
jgi:hypothetical protein